jgi:hypothetical protein
LSANCFQKAAVWSFEYSAATNLIDETVDPLLLPPLFLLPLPLLQAASARTAAPIPASSAVFLDAIDFSLFHWPIRRSARLCAIYPRKAMV